MYLIGCARIANAKKHAVPHANQAGIKGLVEVTRFIVDSDLLGIRKYAAQVSVMIELERC